MCGASSELDLNDEQVFVVVHPARGTVSLLTAPQVARLLRLLSYRFALVTSGGVVDLVPVTSPSTWSEERLDLELRCPDGSRALCVAGYSRGEG